VLHKTKSELGSPDWHESLFDIHLPNLGVEGMAEQMKGIMDSKDFI